MRHACKGLLLLALLIPLLVNAQDINQDLFVAVKKGDTATIQALLEAGADVNAKDRFGMTVLIVATATGHTDAVRALLEGAQK